MISTSLGPGSHNSTYNFGLIQEAQQPQPLGEMLAVVYRDKNIYCSYYLISAAVQFFTENFFFLLELFVVA